MELLRGLEQQGILEQMSRVRAYCKDVYDLARVTGRAVNNSLGGGVHKFLSSGKVENYAHVSAEELPALLRAIQSYPHAKDVQLGLRLLTLLGAVRGETPVPVQQVSHCQRGPRTWLEPRDKGARGRWDACETRHR